MQYLKQSTAVTLKLGPFLDDTDGKTAETALTIAQVDVRLSKNGGDIAQKTEVTSCTHDELGIYGCPIDVTDTNTLGRLQLFVHESGALPVWHEYLVIPANVYDSMFSTDKLEVDLLQIGGVAQSATDLKDFADAGYDPASNKIEGCKVNDDMVGTANAALASVCTEARLAQLAAANIPADVDTLLTRITAAVALASVCTEGRLAHLDADISTRSSHAAADTWSVGTRALTDKAGFTLSTAGILAIWHQLTANIVTANTIGKLLKDDINATISSRSSHSAADVWSAGSRELSTPANYKADVSALALEATLTDIKGTGFVKDTHSLPQCLTAAGFSTHTAANVWSVGTRALTDKSGFSLSAAAITAIWDNNISAYSGVGYAGTYMKTLYDDWLNAGRLDLILDTIAADVVNIDGDAMRGTNSAALASVCTETRLARLDAAITTRSSHNAAAIWSAGSRALSTPADYKADISAIALEATLTAMKGGTFSGATDSLEAIRDRGDASWVTGAGGSDRLLMVDTTIATLASQTSFTLTAGSVDDNAYNNCTIVIEDASTATQKAVGIISDYVGSTKTVTLKYDPSIFTMAATDKVYILAENALKATLANRQLNVAADGDIAGNVDGSVASLVGHTVQTGDNYARLGAPAGASLSADLLAIDNYVDELESRLTATRAGYIDNLSVGAAALEATLSDIKGTGFVKDTHSLPQCLTAAGFSTHTAADIWSVVTRALTDKAGFALSSAAISAIWNKDISAYEGAGYAGTYLKTLYDDWLNGGRLDLILDAIAADVVNLDGDAMRGTDSAALASICTETRLAELAAANLPTDIDAILADTGTDGVVVAPGSKTGYTLSTAGVDAILDEVVEGTTTFRQMLRIFMSALSGKSAGGGTVTLTFRDVADAKDRITATVDENGNRTTMVLDGT